MNNNIITEYPLWFIIFCILLGALYAFILYYREKQNEFSPLLKGLLGIIRTIVVSIIAFLLLNPLIKSINRHIEKPVIIFAQDNSSSITTGPDSIFYLNDYKNEVNQILAELGNDYQVRHFTFGDDIKETKEVNFTDTYSDFSQLFNEVKNRYSHRNVGAMIVASDGIYNRGMNPAYSSDFVNFPIYTIALGDTMIRKDIILNKVNFNRIAYLNNEFPVEVIINGKKCDGLSAELTIEKGNSVVFRKRVNFKSDNDFVTVKTHIKAEQIGLQKYKVRLSSIDGEISVTNNKQDIFVDILEGKNKILLLANSPHPDLAALKQSISNNINYTFDSYIISDFDKKLAEYNLVILHGLPSVKNNITGLLSEIKEQKIPVLYIVTKQTYLKLFNDQKAGLNLSSENLIYNESQPLVQNDFNLFSLSTNTEKNLNVFPPVISPYGNLQLQPTVSVFLKQKIGSVNTEEPLFIFNQMPDYKTGVILGEGIWKWRMNNFANDGNFIAFDDLINKSVQFLALRVDKSMFRIFHSTNFEENENIEFEAELYNDIYELINQPEVSITITGSDEKNYPFYFSKSSNAYFLDAGNFPPDSYSYYAKVQSGDKIHTESGEFTVSSVSIEEVNTIADHNLLYKLAKDNDGNMIFTENLNDLPMMIKNREDITSISYSSKKFTEILSLPWLLAIVLFLLSLEWFIRKRAGGY